MFLACAPTPNDRTRQTKKFHHKVNTGCLVCRRRRVKCDETKPTCVRCKINFAQCSWPVKDTAPKFDVQKYEHVYSFLLNDLDLNQKVQYLRTDTGVHVGSFLPRPIDLHQGTWQDRRSLDYYLANITLLLPKDAATEPEAQVREVCLCIAPRFAQYSPTVRHAISAEAWADESRMRHANTSSYLQQQRDRHYQATVQALLNSNLYIEEILICCVLLFSYACFVRNPDAALLHVRSGLRMIEEQQLKDKGIGSRRAVVTTIEGALQCLLMSFASIFPDHAAVGMTDATEPQEPFESPEAAHKELRKIIIALATRKNLGDLDGRLRSWGARFEANLVHNAQNDALMLLHQTTTFVLRLLTAQRNHIVDQSRLVAITKLLNLLFSQEPVAVMTDAVRLRDIVRETTMDIQDVQNSPPLNLA